MLMLQRGGCPGCRGSDRTFREGATGRARSGPCQGAATVTRRAPLVTDTAVPMVKTLNVSGAGQRPNTRSRTRCHQPKQPPVKRRGRPQHCPTGSEL